MIHEREHRWIHQLLVSCAGTWIDGCQYGLQNVWLVANGDLAGCSVSCVLLLITLRWHMKMWDLVGWPFCDNVILLTYELEWCCASCSGNASWPRIGVIVLVLWAVVAAVVGLPWWIACISALTGCIVDGLMWQGIFQKVVLLPSEVLWHQVLWNWSGIFLHSVFLQH